MSEQTNPPAPPAGRIESGVVRFGDDWPGIFFRGDDALAAAHCLEDAASATLYNLESVQALRDRLLSCQQSPELQSQQLRSIEQCRETPPPSDATAARIIDRLERTVSDLRKTGKTSVAIGYVLSDLARDCGYKEPQPGLDPDELASVVRLARAAPTGDVAAYVETLRKDLAAWSKASRTSSLSWASLLGVGMLGIGAYLAGMVGGKGATK